MLSPLRRFVMRGNDTPPILRRRLESGTRAPLFLFVLAKAINFGWRRRNEPDRESRAASERIFVNLAEPRLKG